MYSPIILILEVSSLESGSVADIKLLLLTFSANSAFTSFGDDKKICVILLENVSSVSHLHTCSIA